MVPRARSPTVTTQRSRSPRSRRRREHGGSGSMRYRPTPTRCGSGRPGARPPGGGDVSLDRISLEGLRVFARHGVREHERRDGQEFIIDAVLRLDTRAAAADDDLSLTVDYGAVADRLARLASGPPGRLVETPAERLGA